MLCPAIQFCEKYDNKLGLKCPTRIGVRLGLGRSWVGVGYGLGRGWVGVGFGIRVGLELD